MSIKSMSIKMKLTILVLIPILAALVITGIGLLNVNKISENLTESLYEEGFKSVSLVLNADRDFYQAQDALNGMLLSNSIGALTPEIKEEYVAGFDENITQTEERVGEAVALLGENKEFWEVIKDEQTGQNVFEHYALFEKDFKNWIAESQTVSSTNSKNDKWISLFDSSREQMNVIGELVEVGIQKSINESEAEKAKMTTIMLTIDVVVLVIVILLSAVVIKSITGPLKKSVIMIQEMVKGHLSKRLKLEQRDEIGVLGENLDLFADNLQKNVIGTMKMISEGNLSIDIPVTDSEDEISPSLKTTIETLKALVKEAEMMTEAAVAGNLSNRGNAEQFNGGYRDIVEGFNETLNALIDPMKLVAKNIHRIGKGDIPEKIETDYQGDFGAIIENLNACIEAVGSLVADTNMLSEAAISGDFMKRAEAEKHLGDFRKVIEGINGTLDAVADKAVWYMAIIDAIPFPVHVTDMNMKWTLFNKAFEKVMVDQGVVRNRDEAYGMDCYNANATICQTEGCGIRSLVEKGIGESYFEWAGKSNKQDTAYLKDRFGNDIGFVEVVTDLTAIMRVSNYTKNEVKRLEENLKLLANGNVDFDLNIGEADEYTEEVSQQFKAIGDSIKEVKEAVGTLIEDAAEMTKAAVGGNLKNRADATRHGGEFAKIMEGFNKTLDAVIAPIEEASAVLSEMAAGNLKVTMDGNYRGDHAVIKDALNETIENIRSYVDEISEVLAEVGNGNLDLAITADYKGDFVEIKDSLNNIISSLTQVMGDIGEAANQVASGANQVSDGSQTLSQGSTEQASSVEELTASIAEIANQTKQNAVNANQASTLAGAAKENAEKGNGQMKDMLNSMTEINESSANISKIIKVIDDIAFQTNILALNAAVEAPI